MEKCLLEFISQRFSSNKQIFVLTIKGGVEEHRKKHETIPGPM